MSSHAQIGPQGAEKQLTKVNVVGGGGGGGRCRWQTLRLALAHEVEVRALESLSII